MGKPHSYFYDPLGDRGARHGEMICSTCHKPIDRGIPYRAYVKPKHGDWGYVTTHKSCCEGDPEWKRLAEERITETAKAEFLMSDIRALVKKHNLEDGYDLVEWVKCTFDLDEDY